MEFNTQKTIYRQIVDYILDHILSEELKSGDRLQSVRELAAEVQVNPNTVVRTFNFLSEQDIIYNRRGIGYYIAEGARAKAYAFKRNVFIKEELPTLFKTMDLLNIDFPELQELHQKLFRYEN